MSLSHNAIAANIVTDHQKRSQSGPIFPLILVCTALALFVISTAVLPVTLNAPGAVNVFVGP
jgi:hypothetical protein